MAALTMIRWWKARLRAQLTEAVGSTADTKTAVMASRHEINVDNEHVQKERIVQTPKTYQQTAINMQRAQPQIALTSF